MGTPKPGIYLGKVVNWNDDGTFDVTTEAGATFAHVPVVSPVLGTALGRVYLPKFDLAQPLPPEELPVWDTPGPSGTNDLYCVLAFWGTRGRSVAILGFVQPPINEQMVFATQGLDVDRHESDVWSLRTPDGATEVHYPDGTYLRVGATLAPHDMAAENPKWAPKTNGTAVQFEFRHSSGFTITFDGTKVAIGAGTQHTVALADLLVAAFNAHTHGETGGGNTGTPNQQMTASSIEATSLTSS